MEKLAIPEPAPYEILVKVEAVGVCASDGKCWVGAEVYWGKPGGLRMRSSSNSRSKCIMHISIFTVLEHFFCLVILKHCNCID